MRRAALLALLLLAAAPSAAAAACPKTSIADVEDEVMCLVCGTPLNLANEAPQAVQQRELIGGLVEDCRSKDEIKARLVAEFGEDVLATPGGSGFDLAAYLVPAIAVGLGGGALAFAAVGWRRNRRRRDEPAADGAGGAADSSAAARRLDADLDRYDL